MLYDEIGDKQAGGCSRNNVEIDSGSEEENGSDFDEEWLDDVEYESTKTKMMNRRVLMRIYRTSIFGGTSTVIASGPLLSNNVQSPTGKSKAKKVVQQVKPWVGKTKRSSSVTIQGNGVFLSPNKKRSSSQRIPNTSVTPPRIPNTSVTPPRTSQSESSTPLGFSLCKSRRVDGMLSTQGSRS
ncbi:hypothetical protein ACFE04_016291 [Oxalis oulophora]